MIIKSLINTTAESIEARDWNPYLGISINNRVFTVDYLFEFMEWATARARDGVAVVIVDVIQSINNQVLDRSKPMAASEKAFRIADDVRRRCDEALARLDRDKAKRITILEWPDLIQEEHFSHNLAVLSGEYARNAGFRDLLISVTRQNLGTIVERLDQSGIEKLSRYILNELPEILGGFIHNGIHFNLNVYPGEIVALYSALTASPFFPAVHSRLRLPGGVALIEAYGKDYFSTPTEG